MREKTFGEPLQEVVVDVFYAIWAASTDQLSGFINERVKVIES